MIETGKEREKDRMGTGIEREKDRIET